MSSSGWGGPGGPQQGGQPGPQGGQSGQSGSQGGGQWQQPWQQQPEPWQPQGSGQGAPQSTGYGAPQGNGYGSPQGGGFGGPQGPGYGGPQGPGGPGVPQGQPPQPPQKKRPWALLAVAASCVVVLILVVGGGVAFLALRSGEPAAGGDPSTATTEPPTETGTTNPPETTSPTEATSTPEDEGSGFTVISQIDVPPGDADDLWAIMADNPLSAGKLPDVGSCELPATPSEPTKQQQQAVLDAATTCLNQVWATASSDRELPWVSPTVVVYTHPDIPSDSPCESNFSADQPRMCNLNSTIYWPEGYGTGVGIQDEAAIPGAYLFDLAYMYTQAASWNSSLGTYYTTLADQLEGTDEERGIEAWRRYNLQWQCIAAASTMQMPSSAEPTSELRDALTDPTSWTEGTPPRTISPEARVRWLEAGFGSGGDLTTCNTWTADADQVA